MQEKTCPSCQQPIAMDASTGGTTCPVCGEATGVFTSQPQKWDTGLVVVGIIFGIVFVGFLLYIMHHSLQRARSLTKRSICGTNLNFMGQAMASYSEENEGQYPPNLDILIKETDISSKGVVCPYDPKNRYLYRYVPDINADGNMILFHEHRDNYHGQGRNVLFAAMNVAWLSEEEFQQAIKEDNQLRTKSGLPTISAD